MTDHTVTESHDPALSIPGHHSLLVYVHETKSTGLHCDGCPDWYGGRFKGRWAEKQMAEAWARHVADVKTVAAADAAESVRRSDAPTRCAAVARDRRCHRPQGHEGRHRADEFPPVAWADGQPVERVGAGRD